MCLFLIPVNSGVILLGPPWPPDHFVLFSVPFHLTGVIFKCKLNRCFPLMAPFACKLSNLNFLLCVVSGPSWTCPLLTLWALPPSCTSSACSCVLLCAVVWQHTSLFEAFVLAFSLLVSEPFPLSHLLCARPDFLVLQVCFSVTCYFLFLFSFPGLHSLSVVTLLQ